MTFLYKYNWVIVNSIITNKLQLNFNQNTKLFVHENASENVICEYDGHVIQGEMSWSTMPCG